MSRRFMDRLQQAVLAKGPLCVGLDPVFEKLPAAFRETPETTDARARACGAFSRRVVDAVADIAAAVKVQVAFFELYGPAGYRELEETVRHAREQGLLVISDCKRGDIGSTMRAYAEYHLSVLGADAVTANPYMGRDVFETLLPHLDKGAGAFFLVRTSNPGAAELQGGPSENTPFYMKVARLLRDWQETLPAGESGYLPAGAVVGATAPEELAEIRETFPDLFLLVPGFGHQGGSVNDVAGAFAPGGGGALVNASRSVIYSFRNERGVEEADWQEAVRREAEFAQQELMLSSGGGEDTPREHPGPKAR